MGSEWASLTIGDLVREGEASVQTGPFGSQLHSHDYVDSGTAVIPTEAIGRGRILDIKVPRVDAAKASELSRHRLRLGDILFARRGAQATGLSAIVDERFEGALCGTGALLLRVQSTRVDPRYLSMFLSSEAAYVWLRTHAVGAVMPNLNTAIIQALPISLPRIHEQQRIAGFIGALDNRITLLRETNATLEAIAQALFKSWFVDFDPVRAKMEGRTPEGMDEATAALFPDGFETSELGEVPRGWRVGQVADLGDVVCGKTPPTSAPENYGGDVPFITIPDMHDLLAVTTTARSLSKLGADSQPKKYLPPGAICVSCIATPGLVVRVTTTAQTNQQINSVIPHRKWGSSFPLFLLRRIGDAVRSGGSGGSVFHNLSKSGFEQLPVLLTEPELADRFNAVIDPLVEKIVANQLQTQTLSTLRDTLLPRLISGQLRLPEAQAAVEGAL